MLIAGMILGILGGLFGVGGAFFAMFMGGFGEALGAEGASTITGLGFLAIPLALLGIVGGALALAKPKAAGILMLIAGIGGLIAISGAYIVAGILLILGGIFALVGKKKPAVSQTTSTPSA